MNVKEAIAKANLEIELNLRKCCIELLDMGATGILRDGEIRRIVSIVTDNTQHDISYHDASSIVFSAIHEQAMMVCAFGDEAR